VLDFFLKFFQMGSSPKPQNKNFVQIFEKKFSKMAEISQKFQNW